MAIDLAQAGGGTSVLGVPVTGLKRPHIAKANSWSVGSTTLYTVPEGKQAIINGGIIRQANPAPAGAISLHAVPSGGAAATTNAFLYKSSLANDASVTMLGGAVLLSEGDSVRLNCATANATGSTGFVHVTALEFDATDDFVSISAAAPSNADYTVPEGKTLSFPTVAYDLWPHCLTNTGGAGRTATAQAKINGDGTFRTITTGTSVPATSQSIFSHTLPTLAAGDTLRVVGQADLNIWLIGTLMDA